MNESKTKPEQLTDDAHAADVAALVAQLEAAQSELISMTAARDSAFDVWEGATNERDAAYEALESANALLARAQDGRPKRPRDANADAVQLDYDISKHLERNGWQWDAFQRKWRSPGTAETATWTEYRGREQ